jgi:hypothetical protein
MLAFVKSPLGVVALAVLAVAFLWKYIGGDVQLGQPMVSGKKAPIPTGLPGIASRKGRIEDVAAGSEAATRSQVPSSGAGVPQ